MTWRLIRESWGAARRPLGCGLAVTMMLGCGAGSASLPSDESSGGAAPAMTAGTGAAPPLPTGTAPPPPPAQGGAPSVATATGGAGGAPPSVPPPSGPLPFAGYDPSVQFDWPESVPSAGSCEAGQYDGAFNGFYLSPIAVALPVPITGTVTHRLEQAANGEFFEIRDGKVEGMADTPIGPVPFTADFTGELNCAEARLEGAYLRNGHYTNPLDGVVFDFEGPVEAMYDKLAHQFVNGTWFVGEPTWATPRPLYGGDGQWGSQWVGP